ncbi:MAG: phosphate acetyltransferase [Rikenellaceae bacterium]|nr:phosphate acetyltransferase [Rikenellaceae bacterium]
MEFIETVKGKAREEQMRIVLPEGTEERTLKAADRLISEGIARVILLGNPEEIHHLASEYYLENIGAAEIVDPLDNPKAGEYAALMVRLRSHKGVTEPIALELLKDPLYLGAVMVKAGDADGEVAGADNATGDVLRPALQYVKTAPGVNVISGSFIMNIPDTMFGDHGMMIFADCAVHPNPSATELAEIAVSTGRTARAIVGMEPRIAMLSFSTKGSAKHEMVDKVVEATRLAREIDPTLEIDGELQADAAIVPGIGAKKAPGSNIAGKANVLVFPSLDVGNIAYKLVQRMAKATAVGPILQGMAAPVNDLSRGCSVEDIVSLAAITACQAQAAKRERKL